MEEYPESQTITVAEPGGIDVDRCTSCGKPHQNLGVTKYIREVDPWTHWYTCPMTGDPVSLMIKVRGDHTAQLMGNVVDSLVRADAAGGFMIALWHPEGTNTRTHLHQFNYSNDEKHIAGCMETLKQRLDEHANNAPKKAELKKVEPPRPPVNMFGAQVIEGDSKPSD